MVLLSRWSTQKSSEVIVSAWIFNSFMGSQISGMHVKENSGFLFYPDLIQFSQGDSTNDDPFQTRILDSKAGCFSV